ncbi:hypothetical protein [Bartonella raoultii]|uniref:hypothetical protein n=1 Tax=Bartonella raoultii TaxID=1457020 RepID=UPI001ABB1957|nr:hypothetical protein [Bartonella raoultii]
MKNKDAKNLPPHMSLNTIFDRLSIEKVECFVFYFRKSSGDGDNFIVPIGKFFNAVKMIFSLGEERNMFLLTGSCVDIGI